MLKFLYSACDCAFVTLSQGVRVGDLVVEFGSVNVDNFKNLQDIGSLVQHSQGVGNHYCNHIVYINDFFVLCHQRPIRVVVGRRGVKVQLSLTPQRWTGRGLLG